MKKEAEERRERKRSELFDQREGEVRIKRSKVLESPLAGAWGVTRELGVRKPEGSAVVRAWALGLRRTQVATFRHRHGGGGSGAFVFDTALGVLTHAETLGGDDGASGSVSVFVHISSVPGVRRGCEWLMVTLLFSGGISRRQPVLVSGGEGLGWSWALWRVVMLWILR